MPNFISKGCLIVLLDTIFDTKTLNQIENAKFDPKIDIFGSNSRYLPPKLNNYKFALIIR